MSESIKYLLGERLKKLQRLYELICDPEVEAEISQVLCKKPIPRISDEEFKLLEPGDKLLSSNGKIAIVIGYTNTLIRNLKYKWVDDPEVRYSDNPNYWSKYEATNSNS